MPKPTIILATSNGDGMASGIVAIPSFIGIGCEYILGQIVYGGNYCARLYESRL